jgi:hypothetical protein
MMNIDQIPRHCLEAGRRFFNSASRKNRDAMSFSRHSCLHYHIAQKSKRAHQSSGRFSALPSLANLRAGTQRLISGHETYWQQYETARQDLILKLPLRSPAARYAPANQPVEALLYDSAEAPLPQ